MHKIVVSRWLYQIGVELGETPRLTHVPNGVELETFRILVPPGKRTRQRVGLLAHKARFKGMEYGIEALRILRDRLSDVEAVFFGVGPRPRSLPGWVEYVENPSRQLLAELYNSFAVFIHTSETEGWGLTAAEAMACGCALAAADSGGVRDFAIDGTTALIVPPRHPSQLASAAITLIEDSDLRLQLAEAGSSAIRSFTWDRAADSLDATVRRVVDARSHGVVAASPPG